MPTKTEPVHKLEYGLEYCVLEQGQGAPPNPGDRVRVNYSGWLSDGTLFDSSVKRGKPFEFVVGISQVIEGWDLGVPHMNKGARYLFTIPPELGYANRPQGPIPANSTLVFEIELLDFEPERVLPRLEQAKPEQQQTTETGLIYEVLAAGQGELVKADDIVRLRYAVWSPRGSLLDCSQPDAELSMRPSDFPMPFMKEALTKMRVGARVRCEVPKKLCEMQQGKRPRLPENSPTIWELEVLEILAPLPLPAFFLPDAAQQVTTESGLRYQVLREGTGQTPARNDRVKVHYAGWLTDGTPFDSSYQRASPSEFGLMQVIGGWTEVLQLMKEGSAVRVYIPSAKAYGKRGSPPLIKPDADLVFHIELVKILPRAR